MQHEDALVIDVARSEAKVEKGGGHNVWTEMIDSGIGC